MGLDAAETEAYARSVVQAEFEEAGDEDVVRKLLGDLISAGVEIDDARGSAPRWPNMRSRLAAKSWAPPDRRCPPPKSRRSSRSHPLMPK